MKPNQIVLIIARVKTQKDVNLGLKGPLLKEATALPESLGTTVIPVFVSVKSTSSPVVEGLMEIGISGANIPTKWVELPHEVEVL